MNDGGPAFPDPRTPMPGMSLRDYFAGQIATGMMANSSFFYSMRYAKSQAMSEGVTPAEFENKAEFPAYAKAAYKIADAMLKERGAR